MRLLLSCGEASGDLYAGALTRSLRTLDPGLEIAGLGGPAFQAAGGRLIEDYRGLSVTGFAEIVKAVPRLRAAKAKLLAEAVRTRADALVVIDYFGFNGRLAKGARALGLPVIYYVSPQIWAWRSGRIKLIREVASRMLVIFPFEEQIYREAGVPVEFVGHPLVDLIGEAPPRAGWLSSHGLDPSAPVVAFLPGSRTAEVRRILPTLADAATRMRARIPEVQFVVARAPHLDGGLFEPLQTLTRCALVEGQTDAVLSASDVVVTASGTATVQAALHDRPMVVVYRVSSIEYRIGRPLVKVDMFAMVNLIAGERIVPELIQDDFTPDAVAREALSMLTDAERSARVRQGLARVRTRLGGRGASDRAAQAIVRTIEGT